MLRDAVEDTAAGYFNIPAEHLEAHDLDQQDGEIMLLTGNAAYRKWVYSRATLANRYFEAGEYYISQVRSLRCRLAGYAYLARFKWMLHIIQRDGYHLHAEYPERKSLRAGLWMTGMILSSLLTWRRKSIHFLPVRQPGVAKFRPLE
jgi:phytoene/squalene synthetase